MVTLLLNRFRPRYSPLHLGQTAERESQGKPRQSATYVWSIPPSGRCHGNDVARPPPCRTRINSPDGGWRQWVRAKQLSCTHSVRSSLHSPTLTHMGSCQHQQPLQPRSALSSLHSPTLTHMGSCQHQQPLPPRRPPRALSHLAAQRERGGDGHHARGRGGAHLSRVHTHLSRVNTHLSRVHTHTEWTRWCAPPAVCGARGPPAPSRAVALPLPPPPGTAAPRRPPTGRRPCAHASTGIPPRGQNAVPLQPPVSALMLARATEGARRHMHTWCLLCRNACFQRFSQCRSMAASAGRATTTTRGPLGKQSHPPWGERWHPPTCCACALIGSGFQRGDACRCDVWRAGRLCGCTRRLSRGVGAWCQLATAAWGNARGGNAELRGFARAGQLTCCSRLWQSMSSSAFISCTSVRLPTSRSKPPVGAMFSLHTAS
jgi:hypothetical protein